MDALLDALLEYILLCSAESDLFLKAKSSRTCRRKVSFNGIIQRHHLTASYWRSLSSRIAFDCISIHQLLAVMHCDCMRVVLTR